MIPSVTWEVVRESTFCQFAGTYSVAKVQSVHFTEQHLAVIRAGKEITVISAGDVPAEPETLEVNPERWVVFSVRCAHPFSCIGYPAVISGAFLMEEMDMLLLTTFQVDLVLVKEADRAAAHKVLLQLGMQESGESVSTGLPISDMP